VRIDRDAYAVQSVAYAEVLTPALTWTELVRAWPAGWHKQTPAHNHMTGALRSQEVPEPVGKLADWLLERALAVLP
jgi:hypothetical protein